MKKKIMLTLLAILLVVTAALSVSAEAPDVSPNTPPKAATKPAEITTEPGPAESTAPDYLNGLIKDEYKDLEITAAVLPRMAILPGSVIPVTVTVKNNGTKTILYVLGSGSHTTPDALHISFEGLQPIIAKDKLGIATMDYVTKELKPGESLTYTLNVLAAQPDEKFDEFTYNTFNKNQTYVGEMDWTSLKKALPSLTAAKGGSYEGSVYFLYAVKDEKNELAFVNGPTSYAQADLTIGVNA